VGDPEQGAVVEQDIAQGAAAEAVMKATVKTPTRSMRFLRASIKPENAPTRIARISMK